MHATRYLWIILLTLMSPALAQDQINGAVPVIPADEFGRGTPSRSADGYIAAADAGDYETAAEYLDLRNLKGEAREMTGAELARQFLVIVHRGEWVDILDLVDDPAGLANDDLPEYRDAIGVLIDDGREVELYMQRVPRGDGVFIWKISNASVSLIPELYEQYGYPDYVEALRRSLPERQIIGVELFKWVIVFAAAVFIYAGVLLVALLVRSASADPRSDRSRRLVRFLVLPFGIWLVVLVMNYVATSLGRGETGQEWERLSPIPALITLWMLFAAINLLRNIYDHRFKQEGRQGAAMLLSPASNAAKLLISIGLLLTYLDQIGVNITTVIAGLGVGGVAVALALQKPMEDILGAVTLYAQQPVRVGDFCRIGNETGTIEEIGLRTTRIRTLANTVIAVPNAKLAGEPIDNYSARHKILFRNDLRLRYDTTPEQLEKVLDGIRKLFTEHERVLEEDHRVLFYKIGSDGLLVEVYAYCDTTVWAEFLAISEDLNMQILRIVADAGTSLSPPAQVLSIDRDGATA